MAQAPEHATPLARLRQGWAPALALLAAALLLYGISRTGVVASSDHALLPQVVIGIILLALPGPLLRVWDIPGQILVWNAAGWCLGLVALGLATVGATTIVPLVLLLLALSLWPRLAGTPPLWLPGAIALAGGVVACVILWESGGLSFGL
jgi:hypothetical protein